MAGAREAAAMAAREGRAKLLGALCRLTGDLAAAEDALSEAFAAALARWPEEGVPASPEAWLLTVARRRHLDGLRRTKTAASAETALVQLAEEAAARGVAETVGDRRLDLLFAAAHPAIDEAMHAPLMLQAVLGLGAERIARCWAVPSAVMAQRLVRTKKKIAAAGIPFAVPDAEDRPLRLAAVLQAIYAALTAGGGGDALAEEAEYLSALVRAAYPKHAEAAGLQALCLYTNAAAPAPGAALVPFGERDPQAWDKARIDRAEAILRRTGRRGEPGRYQIEAAIRSAHLIGRLEGRDTGEAVLLLYRRLMSVAPSLGAACGFAGALLERGRMEEAEAALVGVAGDASGYQPYWAVLAALHARRGQKDAARRAYDRAIALTADESVKLYLQARREGA